MGMQRLTYLAGGLPGLIVSFGASAVFLYGGTRVVDGTLTLVLVVAGRAAVVDGDGTEVVAAPLADSGRSTSDPHAATARAADTASATTAPGRRRLVTGRRAGRR